MTTLLQPGYLVSLHAEIGGGVSYDRVDIDADRDGNRKTDRWETVRVISDVEDHERAVVARNKCSSLIRSVCAKTPFGLLCPIDREADLDAVIVEARAVADAYNRGSRFSRVVFWTLKGRIADNDAEASAAIASELRNIIGEMDRSIAALDPKAIRDAVARAKQVGMMLSAENASKVDEAIEAARAAAKEITRRVQKNGEDAATVLGEIDRSAFQADRMAFLDFDAPRVVEALPAVTLQRFDGLEVEVEVEAEDTGDLPQSRGDIEIDEGNAIAASASPMMSALEV